MQATVIIMISWELGSLRVGDYFEKYIKDNLTYYFLYFFCKNIFKWLPF